MTWPCRRWRRSRQREMESEHRSVPRAGREDSTTGRRGRKGTDQACSHRARGRRRGLHVLSGLDLRCCSALPSRWRRLDNVRVSARLIVRVLQVADHIGHAGRLRTAYHRLAAVDAARRSRPRWWSAVLSPGWSATLRRADERGAYCPWRSRWRCAMAMTCNGSACAGRRYLQQFSTDPLPRCLRWRLPRRRRSRPAADRGRHCAVRFPRGTAARWRPGRRSHVPEIRREPAAGQFAAATMSNAPNSSRRRAAPKAPPVHDGDEDSDPAGSRSGRRSCLVRRSGQRGLRWVGDVDGEFDTSTGGGGHAPNSSACEIARSASRCAQHRHHGTDSGRRPPGQSALPTRSTSSAHQLAMFDRPGPRRARRVGDDVALFAGR